LFHVFDNNEPPTEIDRVGSGIIRGVDEWQSKSWP